MRITNSMITANTKANLNTNKVSADKLNTMTASGQKITRPSDDPVIAIRAMRLNTSLTELDQYHGKNIPDANAWFTDTEAALSQADDLLTNIREKLNQASSEDNVTSNVKDILEELKQLKAQYYAAGNTDSAGRTVFTGYRTSEMLTFTEKDSIQYEIYEKFGLEDLKTISYVSGKHDVSKATGLDATYKEEDVISNDVYRVRLSYDKLDGAAPTINVGGAAFTPAPELMSITGKSQADIDAIYNVPDDKAYFIPETGELLLGKDVYNSLKSADEFEIKYTKTEWQKGDLRPEHYFMCKTPATADERTRSATYPTGIEYNFNRIDANGELTTDDSVPATGFKEQELTYEIAYNQSIQINTHASDVFSHNIGRDIDELVSITQSVADSDKKISDIAAMKDSETDPAKIATYEKMYAAAEKENALLKEKMHNMFTSALTSFKNYSDDVNKQIANLGALTSRLEMTKNRVKDQQSNVKKLADDNINADLTETALDYKNAQLALEAAQMAAGKIANQTLLNYI